MAIALTILLTISILATIFCFYLLYRNDKVAKFRYHIIDLIFDDRPNLSNRIKVYESVEYMEMVYKFWKPLRSFYSKEQWDILEP